MSLKRITWLLPVFLLAAVVVRADGFGFGEGDDRDHHRHKHPTPAPEPASLALLGTGLLCLGYKINSKKKS